MNEITQATMTSAIPGAENLPLQGNAELREVIACPSCSLNKFMTASGNCRRCRKPFRAELEAAAETQAAEEMACKGPGGRLPAPLPRALNFDHAVCVAFYIVRKGLDLSQPEMGALIKSPRTYVSKIENCKVVPSLNSMLRILAAVNISPLAFFQLVDVLSGNKFVKLQEATL